MKQERTWSEWAMYEDESHRLKQENARLKELNREMVELLEYIRRYKNIYTSTEMMIDKLLAKAEGEGE